MSHCSSFSKNFGIYFRSIGERILETVLGTEVTVPGHTRRRTVEESEFTTGRRGMYNTKSVQSKVATDVRGRKGP